MAVMAAMAGAMLALGGNLNGNCPEVTLAALSWSQRPATFMKPTPLNNMYIYVWYLYLDIMSFRYPSMMSLEAGWIGFPLLHFENLPFIKHKIENLPFF